MSYKGILRKAGINVDNNTITFDRSKDIVYRLNSSLTTGTIRGVNNTVTMSAESTANIVEGLRSAITANVKTGAWCNAIVGSINYSTSGAAHGMAASICAEMIPPNSSLRRGALYALECCFGCGVASSWGNAGPVAFIKFANWGTKAHFSANAFLFHLADETGAPGALLSANERTLKVRIGDNTKYLYLSNTEDDLGAMVVDSIVLDPGRIATGSLAGAAVSLDATYTYDSGMYLRYAVTDWTEIGSPFSGMYVRAEATTITTDGKSICGATIYGSTQQTMTTGQLNGALIYAYKKGSVTAVINKMYAVQAELTWDADGGTTELTTEAAIILAKVTGGTLHTYTQLHGQIFRFGDMNGGSRTYGNGILMEDDGDTGGTCALTTGINITIGCTTGISIGAAATGIAIARGVTSSAIRIGAWAASKASGNAVVLANTMHDGVDTSQLDVVSVFAESVANLTSAYSAKTARFRHLIYAASDTVFSQETYGAVGQLVVKNGSLNYYHAGLMGTLETDIDCDIQTSFGAAGVIARVDGAVTTIESGGLLAGFLSVQHMSAFTNEGNMAAFATHKTATGIAWPIGLYVQNGSVDQILDAGGSGTEIINDTIGTKFINIYTDCGAASGDSRGLYLAHAITGTGSGEAIRGRTIIDARATGTVNGGHFGIEFGASGSVGGLATGCRSTFMIPNSAMTGGTVCGGMSEIYCEGNSSDISGTTHSIHRFVVDGGDSGSRDTVQNLFEIAGVSSGTGATDILLTNKDSVNSTDGLRINVNGATKYILLAD